MTETHRQQGLYRLIRRRAGTMPARRFLVAFTILSAVSLEKHGIGWMMWDYNGGFGVVTKQDGHAVPDEVTLKALGLKMPAAHR